MRNVKRAIEFEFMRQIDALEAGEKMVQETRGFDAVKGVTLSQRSKEHAHDYRYFPEPDLPPVVLTDEYIQQVKSAMPKLSAELKEEYMNVYGLPEYDARLLSDDKFTSQYFAELIGCLKKIHEDRMQISDGLFGYLIQTERLDEFYSVIYSSKAFKTAANWILGTVRAELNNQGITIEKFSVKPKGIAILICEVLSGRISNTVAISEIFPLLMEYSGMDIDFQVTLETINNHIIQNNFVQLTDESNLLSIIKEVLAKYPEKVAEYKAGKKGLLGLFVGEVMKASKGKADPKVANKVVQEMLE